MSMQSQGSFAIGDICKYLLKDRNNKIVVNAVVQIVRLCDYSNKVNILTCLEDSSQSGVFNYTCKAKEPIRVSLKSLTIMSDEEVRKFKEEMFA